MSVDVTDGDAACAVVINPCTIHGCRPDSVSSQPAVFIRNGRITTHGATNRNSFDFSRVLRRISHRPHSANSMISAAR